MRKYIFISILLSIQGLLYCQVSVTTPLFTYSQDFNSIAVSGSSSLLPQGWFFRESGDERDTFYMAGTGTSNSGNTYSFGPSGNADRAMGGLRSEEVATVFGVKFVNNSGVTFPTVTVTYTGEQWRIGNTGRMDRLIFQYSLDADSLHTGIWNNFVNLDFIAPTTVGPVGQLNGNLPENRRTMSFTIPDLNIPPGGMLFLRWVDFNADGEDDGLGVDDFIISNTPLPVIFKSISARAEANSVVLRFTTESEINNAGFIIERAADGMAFEAIGSVNGAGKTGIHTYSYTDKTPFKGHNFYRVVQVDLDNRKMYSEIVTARFDEPGKYIISGNLITDALKIQTDSDLYSVQILDQNGKIQIQLPNLSGNTEISAIDLIQGTYYLHIISPNHRQTFKIIKL